MSKHPNRFTEHLKDWWWLYGVGSTLCGLIILWGGIPGRIAKAEQQIERVDSDIDDLKGWAREVQGYTRAMQQQQASNSRWNGTTEQFTEEDDQGRWCCAAGSRQECWDRHLWRACE